MVKRDINRSKKGKKGKVDKQDVVEASEEELTSKAIEDVDSDEEKKVYKKRRFQHRFKLGRHYMMERFSWMFISLLGVLLILFGASFGRHTIAQRSQIGTQAKYTENIEFSLSSVQGTVTDVYRNGEGTRAFVMIDVPNVSELSLDSKNYEIFLTGFNQSIEQEPSASLVVFGSSGVMALEFYDERGLNNEIYGITLRNNSDISDAEALSEEELAELDDPSFGRFDQTEIYVNVGAEDVTTMDVLDDDLDPVQLYYALAGREDEAMVFEDIDDTTNELGKLLAEHNEYANRIADYGFKAPAMPEYMDGDYIDEDGHFRPRSYVEGAHNINYIGVRSTDGFVSQVVEGPDMLRKYMADKRAEAQLAADSGSNEAEQAPRLENLEFENGEELPISEINSDDSTSSELSARDAVNSLNTIWSDYIATKRTLQIDLMRDLLVLDADIRTQGNAYSTHSGESFLTIW